MQEEMLKIRQAEEYDLPEIMRIYEIARRFMAANGNASQWGNEYPQEEILWKNIQRGQLYVLVRNTKLCGVFALISGDDPTYAKIDGGCWRRNAPYLTIHRLASDGTAKGIFAASLQFAKQRSNYLRIDTHENNMVMQHLLEKYGFHPCGTIYVRDGSPRIAYDYLSAKDC